MKRLLILFFILPLSVSTAFSQVPSKANRINFRIVSLSLNSDSSVYIAGNLPQLGNWDPGRIKMNPDGNHTWSITIATETIFPVEYKYTRGSWDREGTGKNGNTLPNFIIKVKGDTTVTDTIPGWLNRQKRVLKGQVTGELKYHRKISGEGLRERDLVVWLPPDYDKDPQKRYPVLYMHDGQNLFDPKTSSFGVDWQIDETSDSLIRNKIVKPYIVVGIYNTAGRMSEYTPGKDGDAYMNLVIKTIKPLIDKTYRTHPDRKNTFIGGSSAGGTISFMLAWEHPEIFSKAFCLSPAFRIQNIDVVKDVTGYAGKKKKIVFYIDNGGKGLEERLQPGVDEMVKALEMKGYRKGRDLFPVGAPDAEHNEAAWAKRMPAALKMMLK